ncbi:hypothetical protein K788_00002130 [Paraburkholderia caribensis MBA4]|uniref:Uncharacterized protein n=1 Tax=Paraburkholderia caribensis MBA4 TaxID=1323664 RepID=A0A0P0RIW9_9BURK|nr:hypothetical protein K788_00002130 [Paraburkholderia caribensis MBA4]
MEDSGENTEHAPPIFFHAGIPWASKSRKVTYKFLNGGEPLSNVSRVFRLKNHFRIEGLKSINDDYVIGLSQRRVQRMRAKPLLKKLIKKVRVSESFC